MQIAGSDNKLRISQNKRRNSPSSLYGLRSSFTHTHTHTEVLAHTRTTDVPSCLVHSLGGAWADKQTKRQTGCCWHRVYAALSASSGTLGVRKVSRLQSWCKFHSSWNFGVLPATLADRSIPCNMHLARYIPRALAMFVFLSYANILTTHI